jgi:hypothetical protein
MYSRSEVCNLSLMYHPNALIYHLLSDSPLSGLRFYVITNCGDKPELQEPVKDDLDITSVGIPSNYRGILGSSEEKGQNGDTKPVINPPNPPRRKVGTVSPQSHVPPERLINRSSPGLPNYQTIEAFPVVRSNRIPKTV